MYALQAEMVDEENLRTGLNNQLDDDEDAASINAHGSDETPKDPLCIKINKNMSDTSIDSVVTRAIQHLEAADNEDSVVHLKAFGGPAIWLLKRVVSLICNTYDDPKMLQCGRSLSTMWSQRRGPKCLVRYFYTIQKKVQDAHPPELHCQEEDGGNKEALGLKSSIHGAVESNEKDVKEEEVVVEAPQHLAQASRALEVTLRDTLENSCSRCRTKKTPLLKKTMKVIQRRRKW